MDVYPEKQIKIKNHLTKRQVFSTRSWPRERHWCSARRGAMAGMFGKKEKKEEDLDPELGPTIKMDVPSTFQGWCTLISRVLAPAEELSPFKLGQIQKLIADMCVSQPTPAAA